MRRKKFRGGETEREKNFIMAPRMRGHGTQRTGNLAIPIRHFFATTRVATTGRRIRIWALTDIRHSFRGFKFELASVFATLFLSRHPFPS